MSAQKGHHKLGLNRVVRQIPYKKGDFRFILDWSLGKTYLDMKKYAEREGMRTAANMVKLQSEITAVGFILANAAGSPCTILNMYDDAPDEIKLESNDRRLARFFDLLQGPNIDHDIRHQSACLARALNFEILEMCDRLLGQMEAAKAAGRQTIGISLVGRPGEAT